MKKIIPCLDIKNGRAVKGINFVDIKDAGDIVELATAYAEQGADELVLLDITASNENRKTSLDWIDSVAKAINIPFTIGGGIASVEDAEILLNRGASKVSINTRAVETPKLITDISSAIGKEKLVVAVDGKLIDNKWYVVTKGGANITQWQVLDWIKEITELGAGEILFTSMSHDGTKSGYPIEILEKIANISSLPVIASGGAGTMEHFYDAFVSGKSASCLAASVFHFGEISIPELKKYLTIKGVLIK